MTIRYCGPGGSDANSGLTYALRKLTLNGLEDSPVAAGDVCYISPGVYRELLTVDVSGSSGSPIEYLADVTGRLTDGIGGIVRITGSDNDTTATRANCITATSKDYRTFTGFAFDTVTSNLLSLNTSCSHWILQDCYVAGAGAAINSFQFNGTGTNNTIRRCTFLGSRSHAVRITHTSTVSDAAYLIENCLFVGLRGSAVTSARVGGVVTKNNIFAQCNVGVATDTAALAVGQTVTVNNSLFDWCNVAVAAVTLGEVVENYNSFWGNITDRTNTATGANSNAYPPLFNPQLLLSGVQLPNLPMFGLSEWSALRAIAGTGMSSEDIFGITRPATDSKKSWGAIQYAPRSREVTTVRTGSASLKLSDAGSHQIEVEVSNVSTIFSCYVQWEADYAGTKPQMIIKQAGQSDTTVTATGSSGTWELLTTTLTPAALPKKVTVELRSNNTAASANFDVFFDDFTARAA